MCVCVCVQARSRMWCVFSYVCMRCRCLEQVCVHMCIHVVVSLNCGIRSASLSIWKWKEAGMRYWLSLQNLPANFIPVCREAVS